MAVTINSTVGIELDDSPRVVLHCIHSHAVYYSWRFVSLKPHLDSFYFHATREQLAALGRELVRASEEENPDEDPQQQQPETEGSVA